MSYDAIVPLPTPMALPPLVAASAAAGGAARGHRIFAFGRSASSHLGHGETGAAAAAPLPAASSPAPRPPAVVPCPYCAQPQHCDVSAVNQHMLACSAARAPTRSPARGGDDRQQLASCEAQAMALRARIHDVELRVRIGLSESFYRLASSASYLDEFVPPSPLVDDALSSPGALTPRSAASLAAPLAAVPEAPLPAAASLARGPSLAPPAITDGASPAQPPLQDARADELTALPLPAEGPALDAHLLALMLRPASEAEGDGLADAAAASPCSSLAALDAPRSEAPTPSPVADSGRAAKRTGDEAEGAVCAKPRFAIRKPLCLPSRTRPPSGRLPRARNMLFH